MQIAQLVRDYFAVLAWPIVALIAILKYKEILCQLIPRSKVKLTVYGVSFEALLPEIEHSITESLGDRELSPDQLLLLKQLRKDGRVDFDSTGPIEACT